MSSSSKSELKFENQGAKQPSDFSKHLDKLEEKMQSTREELDGNLGASGSQGILPGSKKGVVPSPPESETWDIMTGVLGFTPEERDEMSKGIIDTINPHPSHVEMIKAAVEGRMSKANFEALPALCKLFKKNK